MRLHTFAPYCGALPTVRHVGGHRTKIFDRPSQHKAAQMLSTENL
jgi:hypothetical protein